jgi:serine/threonine protein kinase
MDQYRWRAINRIFHAALDLPPEERSAFVLTETESDQALRLEIERLLEADSRAGSYLESPILGTPFLLTAVETVPPLQEDDLLSERFRIRRTLGEGGMGHVFEAFDVDLGVVVALKVIRPEIAGNIEALARFRQEVRLAHSITHPNVCRTYDINRTHITGRDGQSHELVFLTMEYLPGETLAARIRRDGPLPFTEAESIARQIADALTAAHTIGVIHRDIKPANVMLVTERTSSTLHGIVHTSTRAVITDFGLARLDGAAADPEAAALTRSFRAIGTLAYMAPEQLQGASTSSLTDVYAFGLVLFEMVTGQRAFPADNPLAGLAERVAGSPPSARKLVPTLPEAWHRTIEGCLQSDPMQRWQRPAEVMESLAGRPLQQKLSRRLVTLSGNSRKKILAAAIFLVLSVSLSFALLRLYEHWRPPALDPGALVYVTHVKNKTGEKSFDNLSELMQAGLTQSAHINLLDEGRVGDLLQQMTKPPNTVIDEPIAREIALRAGAVRVVFLEVTGSAGNYALHANMQEPDSNALNRFRHHWANSFTWHSDASTISSTSTTIPQELLTAVRDTSNWIRHEAGESGSDIVAHDLPPEDVTTSSWQALRDYAESEKLSRQNQLEGASVALKHAIQQDPNFALAYGRLGDVLLSLDRDSEGFQMYDLSLDKSQFYRLTRKEEDRIRGMRAVDSMDYQAAVDAFHDYAVYYKNDYRGWVYPTLPLRMLGRDEEAAANLRHGIALDPTQGYAPFALAEELMILGRLDEVPQWISYLEKHDHQELADDARASLLLMQGRFDDASAIYRKFTASASPAQRSYSYRELAAVAAEQGHLAEAITDLDKGLAENDSQNNIPEKAATLVDRAYLRCNLKQLEACLEDVGKGYALNPTPHLALAADTVLGLAAVNARPGQKPAIVALLEEIAHAVANSSDGKVSELAKLRTEGEVLLARGRAAEAVEVFQKTAAQDAPAQSKEYLARALVALAATQTTEAPRRNSLEYAANTYKQFTQSPAHVYSELSSYPPGFFRDQFNRASQSTSLYTGAKHRRDL